MDQETQRDTSPGRLVGYDAESDVLAEASCGAAGNAFADRVCEKYAACVYNLRV